MKGEYCIKPGSSVRLSDHDAAGTGGMARRAAESLSFRIETEIATLQELLYAARLNSVLIVLQGMDTSGKDGTIKKVMEPVNPLGVRVEAFKVPTPLEAAHDFLWRVHRQTPQIGYITIFNRSHYEDVLVARVHELVPKSLLRKRYGHINDFERLLTDHGTIILKFFLHISREEQERRLLAREHEDGKAWKLSMGDWSERRHWKAYQHAYEEALSKTSTLYAPWRIVPADKKWARNHAISTAIIDVLGAHKKRWLSAIERRGRETRAQLEQLRGGSNGAPARQAATP